MTDRIQTALAVTRLLNAGSKPTEALQACGIDPENVFSENSEVFGLDDIDNDIIDFGWQDGELIVIRRSRTYTGNATRWEVERTERITP
jgi:hypothetical protein